MTDTFRALCAEMVEELGRFNFLPEEPDCLQRARAALADEPAVPTVMEIIELSEEIEAAGLGQVDFARAVLARWGNPAPAPPSDGEVAELVAAVSAAGSAYGWVEEGQFTRLFNEVCRLASVIEEGCDCSIEGPIDWIAEIEHLRNYSLKCNSLRNPADGGVGE